MKIHLLVLAVSAFPFLAPLAPGPASAQDPSGTHQEAAGQRQVAARIARHPKGGKELAAAIATLIESQTSLAAISDVTEAIMSAADGAAADVVSALAAGLAQGAAVLATTNPDASKIIDRIVAASGNNPFMAGFSVAYSAALATDPSVRAGSQNAVEIAVEAASLPGYTSTLGNTLVSPN
jgi:hypothetical protein